MIINSITSTSVWNAGTRTLTGNGSGQTMSQNDTTVAASGTLDLRPGAGVIRRVSFVGNSSGMPYGMYNGSNIYNGDTVNTGRWPAVTLLGNSTLGPAVFNSNGGGVNVRYVILDQVD